MSGAEFLSGICMATFAGAAVFFLKFWRASRDRFFLLFSAACALLSLERVVLLLVGAAQAKIRTPISEESSWVYLIRLAAFVFILIAIVEKNRTLRPKG